MSDLRTQAPKKTTVIISLVLVALAFFGSKFSYLLADYSYWLILAGYILLLAGVYMKEL